MVRVVFDTVIFVRNLINPHSICGRLLVDHWQQYQLVLSRPVAEEILQVLRRRTDLPAHPSAGIGRLRMCLSGRPMAAIGDKVPWLPPARGAREANPENLPRRGRAGWPG